MKIHPVYFVNAFYRSYCEWFIHRPFLFLMYIKGLFTPRRITAMIIKVVKKNWNKIKDSRLNLFEIAMSSMWAKSDLANFCPIWMINRFASYSECLRLTLAETQRSHILAQILSNNFRLFWQGIMKTNKPSNFSGGFPQERSLMLYTSIRLTLFSVFSNCLTDRP